MSFVTRGTYQREVFSQLALTFAGATEDEVDAVATNIVASADKDELFSWVRCQFKVHSVAEAFHYEWMLIRCLSADAMQDLDDSDTMEYLQKEGRVLKRGLVSVALPNYAAARWQKFEVYNVALNDGEELRLLIRPLVGSTADAGRIYGLLEWRQVGV